jgi:hypothetical protein
MRVPAPARLDGPRRKVHADAFSRLQRRQQISISAPEFQYTQAAWHEESVNACETLVIRSGRRAAPPRRTRDTIPVGNAGGAVQIRVAAL